MRPLQYPSVKSFGKFCDDFHVHIVVGRVRPRCTANGNHCEEGNLANITQGEEGEIRAIGFRSAAERQWLAEWN